MSDIVKETCPACGLAWSVLLTPTPTRAEAVQLVAASLEGHRCYPTEPKGRTRGSLRLDPRRPINPRSIYA